MNIHKIKRLSLALVAAALTISGIATATAATLTVGNASSLPCTGTFPTIQSAVIAASAGDTISVCPGTYNESVSIDKTLTLLGAQNGVDARTRSGANESIITMACSPVQILADNVVLDGFTVEGSTMLDPCTIAGIWMNPGFSGTHGGFKIRNNIVQNNIIGIEMDNTGAIPASIDHNLIQNNNNPGPDGGTGIDTNFGATNVVVDSNKFVGNTNSAIDMVNAGGSNVTFSNNEFDSNRRAIGLASVTSSSIGTNTIHNSTDAATADIRIFGGVSGLSISCNRLADGAGRAIRIDDGFGIGANSNITINFNNISGYPVAGLEVDTAGYSGGPGSLDATNDWWGSSTGPTIASNPGGTGEPIIDPDGVATYKPFLTSPSRCAPRPPPCRLSTSLTSNFNGTAISAGNFVWFNSVLQAKGLGSTPVTIRFTQQTITSSSFTLSVPDAMVTFDPSATSATTTFSGGMWVTRVPSTGLAGNTFFSGLGYMLPSNLPGGLKNVSWSGTVVIDTPGVSLQWLWAAAVYKTFNSDNNALGVKPVDDTKASVYKNSDHAGTPENFKSKVTAGATGGGGSNYTGSYSGTVAVGPCPQ